MRIQFTVDLPSELLAEFLQHVRNYEAPRSDRVHLDFVTDDPGMTAAEFIRMCDSMNPPIPWSRTIKTGRG